VDKGTFAAFGSLFVIHLGKQNMFCPNCGLDEKQPNQFCRACGANLSPVIDAISRPDSVTAAAVSAREEIGRAMAQKIREMSSAKDLKKMAEDVLPQLEKFLESPEQKKMRRMRTGTTLAVIGAGVALIFWLVAVIGNDPGFLSMAALGGITFFIGLAFIINGYLHTVGTKEVPDDTASAESQRILDMKTSDLLSPQPASFEPAKPFRSVTESTTTHLDKKDPR
jgi:hypothetical protein